jgi:imidazolonepropionase-like amidohydrolase
MSTIICPDLLIDGSGGPPRSGVAVRIDGDEITAVADRDDLLARVAHDDHVVEAPNSTLVPGYVDAHVHLAWGLDGQPTWPSVAGHSDGRFAWALAGAQAALASGVTTQRDCGAPDLVTVHLRDAIRHGIVVGPHIVACGPCITTTAGHGDFIGVTADSIDDVRRRVRELCDSGVDFIKVMASGGDMDPHTNRHRPQFSDAEMDALVSDAHRLGLRVVAHCNPTSSIRQAVNAGVDTIAHCNWLGDASGHIAYDPEVAERMLRQGTVIDLNVDATIRPYFEGDGKDMPADFAPRNRWELHAELRERGAPILFSSDEFGARTSRFPDLLVRAVNELDVPVEEVVHRATQVPAAAVGHDHAGVVATGRRADLVLLDGNVVDSPASLARAASVWANGQLAATGGRVTITRRDS